MNFPTRLSDLSEDARVDLLSMANTYVKLPIPIKAYKSLSEFRVNSLEGDYAQGKVGDYLMIGVDNELYICDNEIFNTSYKPLTLKTVFIMIGGIIKAYIKQKRL